ncbi:MAG: hypothetical protein GY784_04045 [Gammaproteobacteria bacterium]|nr:hypothetical protein [Gammaproteobacteria bacterium]
MNHEEELAVQRLLQQFEHQIVGINRRHIKEITGEIDKDDILVLGEAISIYRARYLKAVLKLAKVEDSSLEVELHEEVRSQRMMYEETMQGFAALRHALERGYVVS